VDIADALFVLGYLFGGPGNSLECADAADANDDGGLNVADAVAILGYLFGGAGPLPAPGPSECGSDGTPGDELAPCRYPAELCGKPERRYLRVIYWGQNGYGSTHPDPSTWEPSLAEIAKKGAYDILVLSFLNMYFDPRNPDRLPGLNFSYHCGEPFPGYVSLLNCPEMTEGIKACQAGGMKILLGMGGAAGIYLFESDEQARSFAHTIWKMFLEGDPGDLPRPFGDAILDGVNLDIEAGGYNHHSAFVAELKKIIDENAERSHLITAAPQCPYPDAHLGPGAGSALGDHPELFDHVYVQFYNNYCSWSEGAPNSFRSSLKTWTDWASKTASGPRIFVGLPAASKAAPAGGYVPRDELEGLVETVREFDNVGGFMLWDASFDNNNLEDGLTYSAFLDSLLNSESR